MSKWLRTPGSAEGPRVKTGISKESREVHRMMGERRKASAKKKKEELAEEAKRLQERMKEEERPHEMLC